MLVVSYRTLQPSRMTRLLVVVVHAPPGMRRFTKVIPRESLFPSLVAIPRKWPVHGTGGHTEQRPIEALLLRSLSELQFFYPGIFGLSD